MGTHPIFESDFDCLTELGPKSHGWQKKQHSGQRPLPQGLEAKSPNLVQPARSKGATTDCSKGQGCRHRPTTSWWPPSTGPRLHRPGTRPSYHRRREEALRVPGSPNVPRQCQAPGCPSQEGQGRCRSRQERCPKKEVTFFFCVFATCSSAYGKK